MNATIAEEIQAEQKHGRAKYGKGPDDLAHDDQVHPDTWAFVISDHLKRSVESTPMDRRQHLIKIAGLAVSAVEAFDRKREAST